MLTKPVSSKACCSLGLALLLALGPACGKSGDGGGGPGGSGGSSGGSNAGGRGGSAGGNSGSGSGGSAGSGQGGSAGSGSGGSGNTGSGGSGSGTGGSGSGGSAGSGAGGSTGGSGSGTGGGSGDMAGAEAEPAACAGPNLAAGNRCAVAAQVFKGMGNEPLIDDMEPAPGESPECHKIRSVDGRQGIWNFGKDATSPNGAVTFKLEAPGAGGAPNSTRAIHFTGQGLNGYGGYLATPLAPCYDASAYTGISFWLKGDPSKAPEVKLSFITPNTAPAEEGGSCPGSAGMECYDHATVHFFKVSTTWTRYAITWQQLAQYWVGSAKFPQGFRPETRIIGVNFSPVWANDKAPNKAFDFSVDDMSFDVAGSYADSGFKMAVSKADFDAAFVPYRGGQAVHPLLANAYNDLAEALNDPRFSRIGREGSLDDRKREIAAIMAHLVQESGALRFMREIAPLGTYCEPDATYPCSAGKSYLGRGPIQLTGNRNYGQAGEYLGMGNMLLTNPDRVEQDAKLAWKTALFYWMGWKKTDGTSSDLLIGPHYRFLKEGFGASIRAMNGRLECPPADPTKANNRRMYYQAFCTRLGVGGCNVNLECPAQ